ncbi:MAG: hypothetical protein QE279_05530 [Rhodoferax sp.]|nr:hypothetical protein [Rhodoferax sp.]
MSDAWAKPSNRSKRSASVRSEDGETSLTRSLAVFIAVPLFEFSLYLGLALLTFSPRVAAYTWISLPWLFHVVYCAVVLVVAGMYGMRGITQLLGHLFLTHHEPVRNRPLTIGFWCLLAAATLIAYTQRG